MHLVVGRLLEKLDRLREITFRSVEVRLNHTAQGRCRLYGDPLAA